MNLIKSRCLIYIDTEGGEKMRAKSADLQSLLCALFVLVFAMNAFAGATYQVNTSPLNAVRNGVAEVMGPLTLTVAAFPAPTAINTNDQISIIYPGAVIANPFATGLTVTGSGAFPALAITVANTSIGGQLTITFVASATPSVGDSLSISGVRASVVGRAVGFLQMTQFTASPSGSTNFILTSSPTVALVVDNFSVNTDNPNRIGQAVPLCAPGDAADLRFTINEESLTTWVQHVVSQQGTALPANVRPLLGANSNSQVRVAITGLQTGVTIYWPNTINSNEDIDPGATVARSQLQLRSVSGTGNGEALYEFTTPDQGQSDISVETFVFTFDVLRSRSSSTATGEIAVASNASLGGNTLVAQMFPSNAVSVVIPRFDDPEKTAGTGFTVVECGGEVIYSNFGPGVAFDTNPLHGWTINGFLGSGIGQQAIAHQFTPAATKIFTGLQLALTLFSGPGTVEVFLQADSHGLPGPVLEQINLTGLTTVPTIFVARSVLRPQLQQGTPYWLTVVGGGPGVLAGWNWNSIGDSSTGSNFAGTQGGSPAGPWGLNSPGLTRSAFQINGSPPTAQAAVELLMDDVEALLEAGTLTQDQANGLMDKLKAAIASLNRGDSGPGCNQLRAFLKQVNAFINAGILSTPEGQALLEAAENIRDQVGC